ncbi:MAG: T9SS type A sorting domain-containing protein [Bacteroidetes bacterium]|nr:T9SS type A sorting domain-containing protein [Bacteroidota bacterium]
MKKLTLLLLLCAFVGQIQAQRYISEVFSSATKTTNVPYGTNFTALTLAVTGHTARQPLVMNLYQPEGDVETARPLVIYLHTGNFLPYPQNGSCGGTINDAAADEFAKRLARMGYVVAVADYRTGWNPIASGPTGELTRRATLINAAYRGVQDVRSCIRYFKKTAALGGNPFRVDTSKIVVWGQGTGGYISLAANSLDKYSEILFTSIPRKFQLPTGLPAPNDWLPMVLEAYNGNIYGTSGPHVSDAFYNQATGGAYPVGDTLAVPNHPGYTSNFQLCVHTGGALGDSLWLEKGDAPIISYQVPADPFAPYGTDILIVPTTNEPVVEVSGADDVQSIVARLGNNAIFNGIPASVDPYGAVANSRNAGRNGLFPLPQAPTNSAPWEWTTYSNPPSGCNTDPVPAQLYIDTIIKYYAPRACLALGLPCGFVDTKEINSIEVGLDVAPVPAAEAVNFKAQEPIKSILVFDINGRIVRTFNEINANNFSIQRNGLANGMYFAQVLFDKGFVKRKLVFANN